MQTVNDHHHVILSVIYPTHRTRHIFPFATKYVGAQALEVGTVIAHGHMVVLRPNAVEANAASVRHRKASPEPKLGFMTKAKLVFMPKLLREDVDGLGIDGSNMKKKKGG